MVHTAYIFNKSIEIKQRGERSGYAMPSDFGLPKTTAKLRICDIYKDVRVVTNIKFREINGVEISVYYMNRLGLFIKQKIGNGKQFPCLPKFVLDPPITL